MVCLFLTVVARTIIHGGDPMSRDRSIDLGRSGGQHFR
jgi:hypothetical protein